VSIYEIDRIIYILFGTQVPFWNQGSKPPFNKVYNS